MTESLCKLCGNKMVAIVNKRFTRYVCTNNLCDSYVSDKGIEKMIGVREEIDYWEIK